MCDLVLAVLSDEDDFNVMLHDFSALDIVGKGGDSSACSRSMRI